MHIYPYRCPMSPTHDAADPAPTTATPTTTSVTNPTIPTLIKPTTIDINHHSTTTTLITNPTTPTLIKPTTTGKKKKRSKHGQNPRPKWFLLQFFPLNQKKKKTMNQRNKRTVEKKQWDERN